MLVPPLSNESRTRNDSPVPERLFELSNLLKRTLSPADHAFALRAALEAHAMGADESAVVATAAACGLDRAGEALEPLLTLEELAAASRISVGLLNVRAVAHSSDAVADGMLALARVRIRELLDDARLHSGPDDAALEAPDEYVEPFHDILLATAGRPGAAALRDALHAWVGMLGIEPAWMQEKRPAYWVIGLPGDRNLELFADVFRRLGFLFGKMPGDKGPAGLKPVQGRHVLTVSAPISKADFLRRLMTSIAARHPALFVRAMDRTREGRGLVWERPRGDSATRAPPSGASRSSPTKTSIPCPPFSRPSDSTHKIPNIGRRKARPQPLSTTAIDFFIHPCTVASKSAPPSSPSCFFLTSY